MTEYWQLSAVDQAQKIRQRESSAVEIFNSVSQRMDETNGRLNAIVDDLREAAAIRAGQLDNEADKGAFRGPLLGVPVTVKVNVDMEGTANTNGIPALRGNIAPGHSPVVKNLLDAGAVIIGRTNTPELSMRGTTDNPLYGETKNPWDPTLSPGGSSGGAGAAAAVGMGAIHHGNDIAGSLRFPATACGVATIKAGQGRVPAFNPGATVERGLLAQLMSVQGAICREVKDVRLATQVMMQPDPRDPWHVPMPFDSGEASRRVGVTTEAHGYPIHPQIVSNIERAADILSNAGYEVERIRTPDIREPANAWFSTAILELKLTLDPIAREHGSQTIQNIFDYYYRMSTMVDGEGYIAGVADRTRMVRDWNVLLADYPLVLSPFLMRPGYPLDYDETYEGTKDLFASAIYSFGLNYIGFPAGNIPMGLVDGAPSGVQIIGAKWREDKILDAMESIESETGVMAKALWDRAET